MNIAVSANSLINNFSDTEDPFLSESFLQQVSSHTQHHFIFIFDASYPPEINFAKNVTPVVVKLKSQSLLSRRIWYNLKIPSVLKKYKADIFICEKYCSLKTKIPQVLLFPDLTYLHKPASITKKYISFYKKYTPLFLNKAEAIMVNSNFLKKEIITHYKTDPEKIEVSYRQVNKNYMPVSFNERENIKERYSEANEFFIYNGFISPQKNLINLLKAFSAFKKRQKSTMQLIMTGHKGTDYDKFMESLRLFKFNKEVKVLTQLPSKEIENITASAYAMVYVPDHEISCVAPLEAMQCDVPVISSTVGILPEICADAALYADAGNFKDIAEKMMLLFKDEKLRKELIVKGKEHVAKFKDQQFTDVFNITEKLLKKIPSVEGI